MIAWKYLSVLNACLQVLCTIAWGAIGGKILPTVFNLNFVDKTVQFIFHVALPCLVAKGIGIGVDFYSEKFLWKYIACFLVLRGLVLLLIVAALLMHRGYAQMDVGEVAVKWLSMTWISTIIMGIPILTAVMDNPQKGSFYGLLAGISSFIFQLPFQLFFLECHKLQRDNLDSIISKNAKENSHHLNSRRNKNANENSNEQKNGPIELTIVAGESTPMRGAIVTGQIYQDLDNTETLGGKFGSSKELWKTILVRICLNPVVIGITIGFVVSLSTFGKQYLRPLKDDKSLNQSYFEWLEFLVDTLTWFGDTVFPLSLFSMGIWMQNQGRNLVSLGIFDLTLSMLSKLVLVPLLMVGLSKALHLSDEAGRAAILIAALPISMASFSLGSAYNVGEAYLSSNVAVGTLLMLPTVMIWNYVLDEIGLYEN